MTDPEHPESKKEQNTGQGQLRFELPPGLAPLYANLVRISHTPAEIVFDFARLLPGDDHAAVDTRVLMSPVAAKLFLRALAENLARYEANFGEINVPRGGPSLADNLFRHRKEGEE